MTALLDTSYYLLTAAAVHAFINEPVFDALLMYTFSLQLFFSSIIIYMLL